MGEQPVHGGKGATRGATPLGALQSVLIRAFRVLIARADNESPIQELPLQQVRCLHAIARREGAQMKDVAARMEVDLPGLSRIVDRLARRSMVERRMDDSNRRIVRLYLTDDARAMLAQTQEIREAHLRACTSCLSAEDLDHLISLLRRVSDTTTGTGAAVSADGGGPDGATGPAMPE